MRYLLILISLLCSTQNFALSLRPDYPEQYTVQPGDTLWDIANKYLAFPWEWRELWHANPNIKNPAHLYPGAVIELIYSQSKPYLRILGNGTVKLSPNMRPMALNDPIPTIPLADIKPFLNASLIMNRDKLKNAPYVVGFAGEHLRGGQGDEIFVKNLHPSKIMPRGATISYAVYREQCPYETPNHHRLGYGATLVGYAELVAGGEPATIVLTEITEGVRLKDRVMLNDYPEFNLTFEPKTPKRAIVAKIIDLPPSYTQGAVGLVTVVNLGQNAGLEAGDVLAIYSRCRIVNDPINSRKKVKLPPERIGELMIFRTFSKTSLGLVMRSTKTIHINDNLTNP